jgi:hypothetical protein
MHAAECAAVLGQYECVGRLLAAETPSEAREAARLTEVAAGSVVDAVTAMRAQRSATRDMRLLAEAADLVRRAAFSARIDCLVAEADTFATKGSS